MDLDSFDQLSFPILVHLDNGQVPISLEMILGKPWMKSSISKVTLRYHLFIYALNTQIILLHVILFYS